MFLSRRAVDPIDGLADWCGDRLRDYVWSEGLGVLVIVKDLTEFNIGLLKGRVHVDDRGL
jgi:hypothetical protein